MLSAFTAAPLVELRPRDRSRIESLLAYGDRLLVGLNTGSLKVYRINEAEPEAPQGNENGDGSANTQGARKPKLGSIKTAELLQEYEKFSRYKIEQLAIIKEANLLISLSGGYVSLHDMQAFELQAQLTRTKGASAFAVASNIEKDEATGIPSIVSRLVVAVKRRLVLWTWIDSELVEDEEPGAGAATREVTLPSGIRTLTFATGKKLVAGLSAGYVMIDIDTLGVHEIGGPGSIGSSGQETSRYGMSYIGMGSGPKPLATYLGEGEVMLAKDVNTHFIDTDGQSLERRQIPWTSAPEAVGYSYPYLLALQEQAKGTLEVRNPQTLSLLQSINLPSASTLHIPQPNISLAHAGKGFLVASERTIWRMAALDYDSQIDALVEQDQLDEAISLLNMLEDALLTDKAGRLRETKLRKAKKLFEKRKYREALDLFSEVSAPPEIIIRLYPKSIAGPMSTFVEEPDEEEEDQTSELEETRSSSPPASVAEKGKHSVATGYAPSVRSFLLGRHSEDNTEATAKPPPPKPVERALVGKDLEVAVRELRSFLADIRRRLQRFFDAEGNPNAAALKQALSENDAFAISVRELLGSTPEEHEVETSQKLHDTATLVDTTLFRAYMFTNPRLAGSLFRISNSCDPDVVMEKLEETKRYNDLVDFLYGKKLHKRALEELRKFGQVGERKKPASQKDAKEGSADKHLDEYGEPIVHDLKPEEIPQELIGPKRTVAYLQHLPPSMIDLILEYAEWPIRADPQLGMEVFLADTENAEGLPRRRVLDFLLGIDKLLATRFLEHVIGELGDMEPALHQKLLDLYLGRLFELGRERGADEGKKGEDKAENGEESGKSETSSAKEDDEYTSTHKKFLALLEDSEQYSPAKMLDQLPRSDPAFYEARAIVFSKMGQHKQALEIYVFLLDNQVKAEQYCNKVHAALEAEGNFDSDELALGGAKSRGPSTRRSGDSGTSSPRSPQSASPFSFSRGHMKDRDDGSEPGKVLSIYHTLLSLYLSPPHDYAPQYGPALEILARHGSRLSADSTLSLIPESFPVHDLEFFFRRRMRASTSILNRSKIERGLRLVQNTAVTKELLLGDGAVPVAGEKKPRRSLGRSRSVVVNEERLCGMCHKRLGASVISVFPDNSVVHLGCASRRSSIQA